MLAFNLLDSTTYSTVRFTFIRNVEHYEASPYGDSVNIPTIGLGFNLQDDTIRGWVLQSLTSGSVPSGLDSAIETIVDSPFTTGTGGTIDQLNSIMTSYHSSYSNVPTTFVFSTIAQANIVFEHIAPAFEYSVTSGLFGIPDSSERIALFSLAYNNPSLFGTSLQDAIVYDNRAEAWFEIRYNSNGGLSASDGIAKRRYYESEMFGLYKDKDNITDKEALDAYKMFERHESKISTYDSSYEKMIDGNGGVNANSDYDTSILQALEVQNFDESKSYAHDYLIDKFGHGISIDNIWVDYTPLTGGPIYGSGVVELDAYSGTAGNDLIFTGNGNDTISGGNGNDVFVISEGSKEINGGNGSDTIDFSSYDVSSRIFIVDLSERIYRDRPGEQDLNSGNLVSVENVVGRELLITEEETLIGNQHNSLVFANFDDLIGDNQNNIIDGRGGRDDITGGGGADTFIWGYNYYSAAVIYNASNNDSIQLVGMTTADIAGYWVTLDNGDWQGLFWKKTEDPESSEPSGLYLSNVYLTVLAHIGDLPIFINPNETAVSMQSVAVNFDQWRISHDAGYGGGGGGFSGVRASEGGGGLYEVEPVADKPSIPPLWIHPIAETVSPLIIDLDDDGLELTNLATNPVYWDIDNDGMREATAWVAADDALLVMDWNSNGFIDDHSELFGTNTVDGFTKLTELDSNTDGVINSSDALFDDLQIWQDLNQDGVSQLAELTDLTTAGIQSISLSDSPLYSVIEGNEVTHISSITMTDTTTRDIYDAWFEFDNQNTIYDGFILPKPEIALLPSLRGYGEVKDLDVQMSFDRDLTMKVIALSEMTLEDVINPTLNFDDGFKTMMYNWAGQTISQFQNGVISEYEDSRKVGFVQDIAGQEINADAYVGLYQVIIFRDEGLWQKLVTHYMGNYLFQTVFSDLFEGSPVYDAYAGVIAGATGLSSTVLDDIAGLIDGTDDPSYGWSLVVRTVEEAIGISNLDSGDYDLLDDAIQNSVPGLDLDTVYDLILGVPNEIVGTSSDETLTGTFADDVIDGQSGNDTLEGGRGDDYLFGSYGNDTYIGGSGDDMLDERSGSGNEIYVYDGGNDVIRNELYGTDKITLADGIVLGDITIERGSSTNPNNFSLNKQTDLVIHIAGYGEIAIFQQYGYYGTVQGVETLEFYNLSTINLTTLDDIVYGTSSGETMNGADRSYYLRDMINAGDGNDVLNGGLGNDYLYGGYGNDTYLVGEGVDAIQETAGTDEIAFDVTYDPGLFSFEFNPFMNIYDTSTLALKIFYDGELKVIIDQQFAYNSVYFVEKITVDGIEEFDLAAMNWDQHGTAGNDTIYAIRADAISAVVYGEGGDDYLEGSDHNDMLHGGDGIDNLQGVAGNDAIYGDGGNDNIDGGFGDDTVYGGDGDDYIVDSYAGNDIIDGGDGNDTIYGDYGYAYTSSNDTLNGGAGNDSLYGGIGNDTLTGGLGTDTLSGGADSDTFLFVSGTTFGSVDTISDFNTGQSDVLNIADLLTGYTSGVSDINDFCSVSTSGSDTLFYVDRDGTGATYSSAQIATLTGVTGLDVDTLLLNNNLIAA